MIISTERNSIGRGCPVYIIAEIGINHNGDLGLAKELVRKAKDCGANSVKFQKFTAAEFVSDSCPEYTYISQGQQITESQIDLFQRHEFSTSEWKELFEFCQKQDIDFFVTPQNPSDLDFILSIAKVPLIKVGADDLTNLKLLEYYAKKGIPLIISAGMAYISEIEDAFQTIVRKVGNQQLIILHCVSSYPADDEEVLMQKMKTINQAFSVIVGFSDHTVGHTAAVVATVMGANVIEKHFTLDHNLQGPDHWFSADPSELAELVSQVRRAEKMIGTGIVEPTSKEKGNRTIGRRSIVTVKEIKKGDIITSSSIAFQRPGDGIPPKEGENIIGMKCCRDVAKGEKLMYDDFKDT
ncbi:MAG: N-acetylneuraminate synthase family protein [Euryarchaeota archaeon]|nr:N-acetylneuraminate synthase family protein [Euryarchaeota archaeon]